MALSYPYQAPRRESTGWRRWNGLSPNRIGASADIRIVHHPRRRNSCAAARSRWEPRPNPGVGNTTTSTDNAVGFSHVTN